MEPVTAYQRPLAKSVQMAGSSAGRVVSEPPKGTNIADDSYKNQTILKISKLIGDLTSGKVNQKFTEYGSRITDRMVLLVASAVMMTMMLIIAWLLIRQ